MSRSPDEEHVGPVKISRCHVMVVWPAAVEERVDESVYLHYLTDIVY